MLRSVVRITARNLKCNRRYWIPNDPVCHFPAPTSAAAGTLIPCLDHVHRCFSSSKSTKSSITKTKKAEGKKSKPKGGEAGAAGAEDGEFGNSAGDDLEAGRAKRLAEDEKTPSLNVGPNERPLFTPRDTTLSQLSHKDIGCYFNFDEAALKAVLPEGLASGIEDEFRESMRPALLVRKSFLDLRDNFRRIADPPMWLSEGKGVKPKKQIILDGPVESGKSIALAMLVHWAREEGWLVLYAPKGRDWTHGGYFYKNPHTGFWDTPLQAESILKDFVKFNEPRLRELRCHIYDPIVLGEGAGVGYLKGQNIMPIPEDSTLYDLVQMGIKSTHAAVSVVVRLRKELSLVKDVPVLIAIDQYNNWFTFSEFEEPVTPRSCRPVHARELTTVNAFRSMMHDDMMVGAFSHSTAVGKLRKDLPDVPADARQDFPRYSLDEAEAVCYYYLRENTAGSRRRVAPKPPLTHDDVYSRLRKSSPDLKTLNFFFWCAQQKNYFHDDRAFHHMIGVVERLTRQYKSIDRVIEGLILSGCAIKPRVLLLLLEIFWRGHIYDKAIEVYKGMNSFGYVSNTRAMNMMMDVLFKDNLVDRALEVFQGIRVRNFFSFDIALSHLCSRRDFVKVKIVLKMMIREGFYPNSERFGQVLGVLCRTGCVVEGFQVVGLMICSGISVSVNVWSMLVSGFFRSGEPQKAVDLFKKMIQIGCSPNLVTYTSMIKGFMDYGMIDEAFSVLSIVQSKGLAPDIVLCNVMIHTFTRLGRFEEARNIFLNSLKKGKLVADQYTFASILSSICLSRDYDLRITIGTESELDLVMGNSLINYLCKVGNTTAALKVFCNMSNKDLALDCYTYTGFLTALCRGEAPRDAVNMYYEIIRRKNIHLDAHFHTAIIDSLVELGEYSTAIRLFNRCILDEHPLDVVSYTVAIKGLVRARRMDEACCLLSKMKEDGVMPNRRTYRTIISGLCEEKDKDRLKKILWECIDEGVELDPNTKFKVVWLLSQYRIDCSEFRYVFEKWRENIDVFDSYDELSVSTG